MWLTMDKRLIDAAEIENLFYAQVEHGATDLMDAFDDALQDAPTVDAVEVVRCAQCKHLRFKDFSGCCQHMVGPLRPDGYCDRGESGGQAPQREDA